MGKLAGKVALVTGAGSGIGEAIAMLFAQEGARVAVVDIDLASAERVARAAADGTDTLALAADVSQVEDVHAMIERVVERFGRIDVLCNNAGIGVAAVCHRTTEGDWDRVLAVDLKGVFFCCKAAGRGMVARGRGSIVAIASQNGVIGMPERAAYCSAKAGVVNLVRVLVLEWASHGVRVNAVGPTFVETALTERALADQATREFILGRIPLGRLGTPEEVANAALFLASPAASLVTGHCLLADGGWTAI